MEKILELSHSLKDVQSLKTELGVDAVEGSDSLLFGLSVWGMLAGFFFSMLGLAYFRIGKRKQDMKRMFLGVFLMVYPYIITDTLYIVLVGLVLSLLPIFFKNWFI